MKGRRSISPRKTPSQARSALMVETILEAALRVLGKHGLSRYNTTMIAEEAGASVGSVYQYFRNRDAVTAALILRAHLELLANMQSAITRAEGLALHPALMMLMEVSIPKSPNARKVARLLEVEEERLPRTPEILDAEGQINSLNLGFLRRYVRRDLPEPMLATASFDVVSIIRGMMDASIAREDCDLEQLADRISRAVAGYLQPLMRTATFSGASAKNANGPLKGPLLE
jgi:AcrR family transcriptional regulator